MLKYNAQIGPEPKRVLAVFQVFVINYISMFNIIIMQVPVFDILDIGQDQRIVDCYYFSGFPLGL